MAYWVLGWNGQASLLAGVALSTTSMAVVYSVMLETGFNRTGFGKGILGSCFINDLGTVIMLGLLFAPFTYKTIVFIAATVVVCVVLPFTINHMTRIYGHRTAAIRTKLIMVVLLGLGALAYWAGSEAVLPAYIVGIVLAGGAAQDHHWIRRLRTLTVGFLTPFYFLRAGTLVSVSAVAAAPFVVLALFAGKVGAKIFGLFPVVSRFRRERNERWYYTLDDVDGPHLRHDLGALRPEPRHRHPEAVLVPGRRGDRHGGDPHPDRQPGVRAAPSAAGRGARSHRRRRSRRGARRARP